jgi:hypothetical protein
MTGRFNGHEGLGLFRFLNPSPNPGDTLAGSGLRQVKGREEKRAKNREEVKSARHAQRAAREPGLSIFSNMAEERPETQNETARRIYRAGGKPKRRGKTERRASIQPLKWR